MSARIALERQILVTVTQANPTPLRGAGSSARQYIGSTQYARSERTRRTVARLARQYGLSEVEGWPIRALGVYCVVFEVPAGRSVSEVVSILEGDARVESVQPMQRFEVLSSYDDPYVDMQHSLGAMRIFDVHPLSGGKGITLAVVDTGVDETHADLTGSLERVKDFVGDHPRSQSSSDDNLAESHGTAVAGVIASTANNGIGTVGVAPAARLLALRACWEDTRESSGVCNSFTLAKALAYVVDHRPDIVNLSLGGPRDPLLERLLKAAIEAGIAVVTAYDRRSETVAFPGSLEGVIVVQSGAVSSVPSDPELLLRAPGHDILAARPGNAYDFVSGSSFAAAHVTGIVALLLERAPNLAGAQLYEILHRTSRPIAGPHGVTTHLVDACAALERAVPGTRCESVDSGG